MKDLETDADLTHVKNKAPKEKKDLKNTLSSIGNSGLKIATGIIFLGTIGLTFAFPGESINVSKGANLSGIAQQYGTTWQRLQKRNKLENPDYIQAGQNLIIYDKGPVGLLQTAYDIVDKHIF
jgi:hypothetical protein